MNKCTLIPIILLTAFQVISAGIIKKERSVDLNEDGIIDFWSISYFRNQVEILEKITIHTEFNSELVVSHVNRVLLKDKSIISSMRRGSESTVTIFNPVEGIEYMQFDHNDDPNEKRIAVYSDDASEYIELFSINHDGDLIPVVGEEYKKFTSEMGFSKEFTKAVVEGQDSEKIVEIVEEYQKQNSDK